MTVDKENVSIIEQAGATHPLTELLHSSNEATATYAKDVLFRISESKSQEYRKRTSAEMTNSFQRDDATWPNDIGLGPDLQVTNNKNILIFF